eukprot:gnl/TRDRNA2_/TRDRNA2_156254_c1_seq1.p1 gnl/TRDRNA2_/TRDRNA2_156254_c1~~gnl/TRDRNA2_/TRDRNA2_156254_c1_seq1.p1  ORF type:complete len:273 (+),score=47.56 gnl/TRDRNA2_/TRDRNA2_156254_c1_seq1:2-820(+)
MAVKNRVAAELRRMSVTSVDVVGTTLAGTREEVLAQRILDVVSESLEVHGLDATRDLGLYLRVSTPAKQWIGASLCGPVFHLVKGRSLEEGLLGWRLMCAARGSSAPTDPEESAATWERTKRAHVCLWQAAGRDPATLERRLSMLEQRGAKHQERLIRRCALRVRHLSKIQERAHALQAARAAAAEKKAARTEARLGKLLKAWSASLLRAAAAGQRKLQAKANKKTAMTAIKRGGCRVMAAPRLHAATESLTSCGTCAADGLGCWSAPQRAK